MSQIDVSTPGFAIDITTCEFIFDGATLSAAVQSMEYARKNEEEVIHYQGSKKPKERTAGQDSFEGSMVWGARQWALFCARFGGEDNVVDKEFTFVCNATPQNDTKLYSYTFYKLRMKDSGGNFDKSAGMVKVNCSYLDYESEVVEQV